MSLVNVVFVSQRSLRRADRSSTGVLPSVVCPMSATAKLRKGEAMTRNRVALPQKKVNKSIDTSII